MHEKLLPNVVLVTYIISYSRQNNSTSLVQLDPFFWLENWGQKIK